MERAVRTRRGGVGWARRPVLGALGVLALLAGPPAGGAPPEPPGESELVGFGAVGLDPVRSAAGPPAHRAGCADTDDEFEELWAGSVLLDPPVPFLEERITRRHFDESVRGRFLQVSERGPSGIAVFVTGEGRIGRLLYRWRGVDARGAPLLELHRIALFDPARGEGVFTPLPARRLAPGDAVELDPPGDGWGAGPDLRHVTTPSGPALEAVEGSELRIATASLCGA